MNGNLGALRKDLSHKECRQEHWNDTADEAEHRCRDFEVMIYAVIVACAALVMAIGAILWAVFDDIYG